jgi:hypothetical protein
MSQTNTETNPKGGPRTAEGKAASSKNSFKHGLASSQILIDDENPAAFYGLVADLEADYQPATETEALLVHDLAKFHWLADRAIRLQAAAFAACSLPEMPASLNVLIRYQTTNQRAFQTTLKSLQALQKERKAAEERFVSQEPVQTPEEEEDFTAGPPEGWVDGMELQRRYYEKMNALEAEERKQSNERYIAKLRAENPELYPLPEPKTQG